MSNNNNKRSSIAKTDPTFIHENESHSQQRRVGGRQEKAGWPGGGGGYLNTCTLLNPAEGGSGGEGYCDPRISELKEIGLGSKWLKIAEAIGFDAFMAMWRILDSNDIGNSVHSSERVRMWIPAFRRYLRYQRNRYISALALEPGITPHEVQKKIQKLLGESLSFAHIKRIMDKVNIEE